MTSDLSTPEANRLFYAEYADYYDAREECVVDELFRRRLKRALLFALAKLRTPHPRVLDACGGSGNASLMLLELGHRPVTVDVSAEMLRIFEQKAASRGFETQAVASEISSFLADDERTWDLIIFSSALHHLEDYKRVVALALERLTPNGLLVTIFDPIRLSRVGVMLRRLDYIAYALLRRPEVGWPRVWLRLRAIRSGGKSRPDEIGARAERWAYVGLEDMDLRDQFEDSGCEVLVHERSYDARLGVTRALLRAARQPAAFHFVVQKTRLGGGAEPEAIESFASEAAGTAPTQ